MAAMTMTDALNRVFGDASERFERANETVAELTTTLSALKQAIAYRKGVFVEIEAAWVYAENLYAACKNVQERDAILALKKKGDSEYQTELLHQRDDETEAGRLEGRLELARGTMSLMRRRMDYAVASRLLEAHSAQ
jgi:hypothetical protein